MDLSNIIKPEDVQLDISSAINPAAGPSVSDDNNRATLNLINPDAENATPQAVGEMAKTEANKGLVAQADQIVGQANDITPEEVEMFKELGISYDQAAPVDVEWSVYDQLLAQSPKTDVPPEIKNSKEWRLRKYQLGRVAGEALEGARKTALEMAEDSTPELSALKFAGQTAAEIFNITTRQRTINILKNVAPEIAEEMGRLNVGRSITTFQNWLLEQPLDRQKDIIEHILVEARKQASDMWQSGFQMEEMTQAVLGGLIASDGDYDQDYSNKFQTAMGWLDAVVGVGVVKAGLRQGVRGTVAANTFHQAGVGAGSRGQLTYLASTTQAGAKRLWEVVRNRSLGGPPLPGGASIEQVIDSVALPKVDGRLVTDAVDLPFEHLPQAAREAALADPAYVHGAGLAARINSAVPYASRLVDGGVEGTMQFGKANGQAFATAASASRAATRMLGQTPFTVVQNGGPGFWVQVKQTRMFGLEDAGKIVEPTNRGYNILKWIGKAFSVSPELNTSSNLAARQTEKTAQAIVKAQADFWKLVPGSRARVAEALSEADMLGRQNMGNLAEPLSITDLMNRGLNAAEIRGYAAIRRTADVALTIKNKNDWMHYTGLGYRSAPGVNHFGFKPLDNVTDALGKGQQLKDVEAVAMNGARVTLDQVRTDQVVARLMFPATTGERFVVLDRTVLNDLRHIPQEIHRRWGGYLPRPYKYPWYVKFKNDDGTFSTVQPARSIDEANEIVADLNAANQSTSYVPVRAGELRESVDNLDELAQLYEANLLNTGVRGPSLLVDASGHTRMYTIEDRIRAMTSDAAYNAGLARWGMAQETIWNNTYGHLFQTKFGVGMDRALLKTTAGGEAKAAEALNYARFIQNTLGTGDQAALMKQTTRNRIADWLYNRGASWLGDEVSGLSHKTVGNAKTAAYVTYISSNPFRQLPLQMSTIPQYTGLVGGAKYSLGFYQRDAMTLLSELVAPGQGAKIGASLGKGSAETKELLEQYARTGITDSVAGHTYNIGTVADVTNAAGSGGRWTQAFVGLEKLLRNMGVDAGIIAEKTSAWLYARNRWLVLNNGKKIDDAAERQIMADAETISLNPNRGDVLPFQRGALGAFTQFLAMQTKAAARVLAAFTPGVKEGNLLRRERMRMAGVNLLTYGLRGFGMDKWAAAFVSDPVFDVLPPAARQALANGLIDHVANTYVKSWVNGDQPDEFGDLPSGEHGVDIAGSFSPVAQIGGSIDLARGLFEMVILGDPTLLEGVRWEAPALGLTKDVFEIANFAGKIAMAPATPEQVSGYPKLEALGTQIVRRVPITNNILQYLLALEYGKKFDRSGNVTADAGVYEAGMALFGVRTREEVDSRQLAIFRWGQGQEIDSEQASKAVTDYARENAKWLLPLLDQYVDGTVTYREALSYLDEHSAFANTHLPQEYRADYKRAFLKLVDKHNESRYDRYADRIVKDLGTSQFPFTEDLETKVKRLGLPPSVETRVMNKIRIIKGLTEIK